MLCTVIGPQDKSYEDLVDKLKAHYIPKPIVISEQFRFYSRKQEAGESIADFVADMNLEIFWRRLCETGSSVGYAVR